MSDHVHSSQMSNNSPKAKHIFAHILDQQIHKIEKEKCFKYCAVGKQDFYSVSVFSQIPLASFH